MKLSIIVPVYNASAYLRQCADSLLAQDLSEYEIIFVNDGSQDDSLSILREYESGHPETVRVLDIDNGGQGRARNFALDLARGEYVGFTDSDDWTDPRMFSSLLAAAEREEADIAVCDCWRVTEEGPFYENATPQGHVMAASGSVWNKIFRRSLIGKIRFPEGVWYEDFSFSAKLLSLSSKTVFVPEALYYYRAGHPSTMRNQNSRKNLDMITVMDDIISFLGEEKKECVEFLLINHILIDSINRVNLQKSPEKKQIIAVFRDYVKKYIPKLTECQSFRKERRNRRIVMWLNYHGLEDVSRTLLALKGSGA